MESYPRAAVERAMKVQEVIMRAMAKKITWGQAGEIIGLCERQMRRWKERYLEVGYDGLFDRRTGKPSPKRVPVATVEHCRRLGSPPAQIANLLGSGESVANPASQDSTPQPNP